MATSDGSGFEPPTIDEFFPHAVLFQGTPFELNRIMLIRLLVVAILVTWMLVSTRRLQLVPGRSQVATEFLFGFVRNSIAYERPGEKDGKRLAHRLGSPFDWRRSPRAPIFVSTR